ncbi:MAG: Mur ligase family protein [Flavobacteriales bacterium]|jgi:UDP-N-acetylmuramate: L-alanyl-gamma-D-glutamyl-meso-diaminopimelate ligase|nr:Mur ligase family protein [Flavobacteriales bacterium]
MNVHFIAIGGSAMHNLAIAMHLKGDDVTGSDDEIFEPSKGRLSKYGLLPKTIGWDEQLISTNIDAVILGMHARKDNPELLKAQELGLKIYSYPEFIYEKTKNKTRVVIGGSHGKTTITSMILHVLRANNIKHDYMVGAQLEGFECMVSLSEDAKIAVLEGDEYLSSPIDLRPKFHLYKPTIGLISGIAWDHINVFPTFENYIQQFKIFADSIDTTGSLVYFIGDEVVNDLGLALKSNLKTIDYTTHNHVLESGITYLIDSNKKLPIQIFGQHNLQNLNGALKVCLELNIKKENFYDAIQSFKGASKRLELVKQTKDCVIYKDFAHSPSKLKATTKALSDQFPKSKLIACMELHTFSSLNHSFLKLYNGTMKSADKAFVYFNPETLKHKKLASISIEEVLTAFGTANVEVFTDSSALVTKLLSMKWENKNLLLMSSGNFDGINFDDLANKITG